MHFEIAPKLNAIVDAFCLLGPPPWLHVELDQYQVRSGVKKVSSIGRRRSQTMNLLLKEIRHNPLLWMLVFVPLVL